MRLQKLPRGIGTLGLVFVLFFSTSGGPYTTETLIYSVGPGLGLLLLALVPLVWSVPEALIVGELASMTKRTGRHPAKCLRKSGRRLAVERTQESVSNSTERSSKPQRVCSFFFLRELCVVVVNQISVTLCPS